MAPPPMDRDEYGPRSLCVTDVLMGGVHGYGKCAHDVHEKAVSATVDLAKASKGASALRVMSRAPILASQSDPCRNERGIYTYPTA